MHVLRPCDMWMWTAIGVLAVALLVALSALAWISFRREIEVRHWKQVARQQEQHASEMLFKQREVRRQHDELQSWIDDYYALDSARLQAEMGPRRAGRAVNNNSISTGRHFDSSPSVVDYVFMWVDAGNPHVESTMASALRNKQLSRRPDIQRVRDDGTFQFALRSVLQTPRLEAAIRNVYIVTSGELPPWLLPWLGDVPNDVRSSLFTRTPLRAPLQPLVDECQGRAWRASHGHAVRARSLYVYPHNAFFPEPLRALPTYNSNAILAALHWIPNISRW